MEKALLDIARRVTARSAGKHASAALTSSTYVSEKHVGTQHLTHSGGVAGAHYSSNSSTVARTLDRAAEDFQSVATQATFAGRMERLQSPTLTTDQDVLDALQVVPFTDAVEALGVLLRAGRVEDAVQLVTCWDAPAEAAHDPARVSALQSRVDASREIQRVVDTLLCLKDAQTLRVLTEVLEASFAEQCALTRLPRTNDRAARIGCTAQDVVKASSYKLITPLGPKRTYKALVRAVDALCNLTEDDGVTVNEKVTWLGKAAVATGMLSGEFSSVREGNGHGILPLGLQNTFSRCIETDAMYSEDLAHSIQPRFSSMFVHPSQYPLPTVLSMPLSEAAATEKSLFSACSGVSSPRDDSHDTWRELVQRFLPRSPPLQTAEVNHCLATLRLGGEVPAPMKDRLRTHIIEHLRSRSRAERRAVSQELLRQPHLLRALHLSPLSVLAVYGDSFYATGDVNPTLSRLWRDAIPRLVRRGRDRQAAQLAWNHLSTNCATTVRLLQERPQSLDAITAAMCRAMRGSSAGGGVGGRGEVWMAHRSLALLSVAERAGIATPLHTVLLCACALDTGANFATVREAVGNIHATDPATAAWVLNCVRLCAASEDEAAQVRTARESLSTRVRDLLSRWCGGSAHTSAGFLTTRVPTRSKQLALWTLANDPATSPVLLSLLTTLFLDPRAREAFLSCEALVATTAGAGAVAAAAARVVEADSSTTPEGAAALQRESDRFHAWEVAASIASNCTNDAAYERLLRSLSSQSPWSRANGPADGSSDNDGARARVESLLRAEVDSYRDGDMTTATPSAITTLHRELANGARVTAPTPTTASGAAGAV